MDSLLFRQIIHNLYYIATLGSSSNRASLAALSFYPHILAIYHSDPAGHLDRTYLSQYTCLTLLAPPCSRSHRLLALWRQSPILALSSYIF